MITVVCWNIAGRKQPWRQLLGMKADVDVAILQEARKPPKDVAPHVEVGPTDHWHSIDYPRWPMIARLSDRVKVDWFTPVAVAQTGTSKRIMEETQIAVSDVTTIAAARIHPADTKPFVAVSMYTRWLKPHPSVESKWGVGYSDASAHRIISDLSGFIGDVDPSSHRILAAGDLNTFYGALDDNPQVLAARDRTVFDRMQALGFEFLGPQYPNGRRPAEPPPKMPEDSKNVPTYFHPSRKSPANARDQLDYVFASRGFHELVRTRALNGVDEWGASDHCRILVEVG